MSLINWKVELKLKWTKYYVLSTVDVGNVNAVSSNIIFTIKDTKSYVLIVTLSARDNQKGFERTLSWNEYKTKSEDKNTTNEYRYFHESNFVGANKLFLLTYLNRKNDVKRFKIWRYYLPKGIIKNYNVIMNGKNFYDRAINSDVKQYEEIRKLTIGQGEA